MNFPQAFQQFLRDNNVDASVYKKAYEDELPRYIRINPRNPIDDADLRLQLPQISACSLPSFFSVPGVTLISQCDAYKHAQIYGMDIASAVAVYAMGIQANDHVLDLCCAPGAKLLLIADILGDTGTVTGVDVNLDRIRVVVKLLRKYKVSCARVYRADGRTFKCPPPSSPVTKLCMTDVDDEYAFVSKRARRRLRRQSAKRKRPSDDDDNNTSKHQQLLYDKVLVDAECTHDGSVKHIAKYQNEWGWDTFERKVLDPKRLSQLQSLQRDLITAGYALLRPGGTLVYSTCSVCRSQNEDIISWFLEQHDDAILRALPSIVDGILCRRSNTLEHVACFDPIVSNTSGLFVARIQRRL